MAEFNISINGEPGQVDAAVRRLLGLPVETKATVEFLNEPLRPEDKIKTPEPEPQTQTCQRCGQVKAMEEFQRNNMAPSGYCRTCKTCFSSRNSEAMKAHRAKMRESKSPPEDDRQG